jgi:uncharacterized protein YcbX
VSDATLSTIRVYPVKALDGLSLDAAALGPDGGLVPDRVVALTDADGDYVNGKNERAIHRVTADYDPTAGTVRLTPPPAADAPTEAVPEPATFTVPGLAAAVGDAADDSERETTEWDDPVGGPDALADWVADYVGYGVTAEVTEPSYPDDTAASGPTLVSRSTLATVADWFDHTPRETLRRFRPNLVVDGDLPAFWEDRLYGDRSEHVRFTIGAATLDGVGPCRRCVVPARDPDTGRETEGFTERFLTRREATLPDWSAGPRFDGAFKLTLNTRMPTASRGETLRVGDPLRVEGSVSTEQ